MRYLLAIVLLSACAAPRIYRCEVEDTRREVLRAELERIVAENRAAFEKEHPCCVR